MKINNQLLIGIKLTINNSKKLKNKYAFMLDFQFIEL
jgi:hypothetical protein